MQSQPKTALTSAFPYGHLNKKEVRALAAHYNLPSSARADSQGICFLGNFKFSDFLEHHLGKKKGPLIEFETGKILGTHEGHWFYTIGQRQGIKLGNGPWYVVSKEATENSVFVSCRYEALEEERLTFTVNSCHFIEKAEFDRSNMLVKIRHRSLPQKCLIEELSNNSYRVTLEKKDQGIAPGQRAVFYNNSVCLGNGIIV